jgi:hypothetical protein
MCVTYVTFYTRTVLGPLNPEFEAARSFETSVSLLVETAEHSTSWNPRLLFSLQVRCRVHNSQPCAFALSLIAAVHFSRLFLDMYLPSSLTAIKKLMME